MKRKTYGGGEKRKFAPVTSRRIRTLIATEKKSPTASQGPLSGGGGGGGGKK